MSVKSASSLQATTKRVTLNLTGDIPALQSVEDVSTGGHKNVNESYTAVYFCTVYCVGAQLYIA